MVEDSPDLSVIVVTYNGCQMALATLHSARASLGDVTCQWLVVDNGSTDGTPDAIEREFTDVCVLRSTNRGFAAGNNAALPLATGRYVLLLNPDVEIERGTLADLVAALDRRPDVGVVSVLQRSTEGRLLPSIRRFPTPARGLGEALGVGRVPLLNRLQELDTVFEHYLQERSVDWLVGAFLLVRRDAIDEIGPLDDGFFLYAEEVDWCRRFRRGGWDVRHLPIVTVTHHEGDSAQPAMFAQLAHSRRRFAYKHFRWPSAIVIHATLVFGRLIRLAVLAPAAVIRPTLWRRVRAEAFGLAVLCGAAPPLGA